MNRGHLCHKKGNCTRGDECVFSHNAEGVAALAAPVGPSKAAAEKAKAEAAAEKAAEKAAEQKAKEAADPTPTGAAEFQLPGELLGYTDDMPPMLVGSYQQVAPNVSVADQTHNDPDSESEPEAVTYNPAVQEHNDPDSESEAEPEFADCFEED